jgi:ribose 5-phosphate isomerase B
MRIHLATDHAGFQHKEAVKEYLISQGLEVIDHGAVTFDGRDDYPDFIAPAAQAVGVSGVPMEADGRVLTSTDVGIIFGASGQGEAMVANRVPGVRATVYYGGPVDILTLSRAHNNANMLSIGASFVTIEEAINAIAIWSEIPFSMDERDIRRLSKFNKSYHG